MNCCICPIEIQRDFCAIQLLSCKNSGLQLCNLATNCWARQGTHDRALVQTGYIFEDANRDRLWRRNLEKLSRVEEIVSENQSSARVKTCEGHEWQRELSLSLYYNILKAPVLSVRVQGGEVPALSEDWVRDNLTNTSPQGHPKVMRLLNDVIVSPLPYLKGCGSHRDLSVGWRKANVTLILKNGQVINPGNGRVVSCSSVPWSNIL